MLKTVKKLAAKIVALSKEISSAFFDLRGEESTGEKGKKVAVTAARRVIYAVADYWLTILSAMLIVVLKAFGYQFLYMFLAMWAFDMIIAGVFLVIWQRTGNDLTLGVDYRRAVDVITVKSRFVGAITTMGILVKAAVWDGPEYVVIFFQKEIKTETRMALSLLILTAVQSVLWTAIYSLGYESVSDLWSYMGEHL